MSSGTAYFGPVFAQSRPPRHPSTVPDLEAHGARGTCGKRCPFLRQTAHKLPSSPAPHVGSRHVRCRRGAGIRRGRCCLYERSRGRSHEIFDVSHIASSLLVPVATRPSAEHKAISATLLAGTVRSCGCLRLESSNGFKDLAGRTFGRLTVIRRASLPRSKKMQWLCLCTCGTEAVLLGCNILSGGTMSCGCARKERAVIRSASLRATMCITSHRRRARVAGSKGTFTEAEVVALYNVQKGRCAEPGCRVKLGTAFHRDHINPLHLGGSNYITNIQLLCPSCNCRKCAKHPITWARENGRLL